MNSVYVLVETYLWDTGLDILHATDCKETIEQMEYWVEVYNQDGNNFYHTEQVYFK